MTAVVLALGLIAWAASAAAQPIERNLPPAPEHVAPSIATPGEAQSDQDATPIGPALGAIVLLGPKDGIQQSPRPGIDVSRIDRLSRSAAAFSGFLGRPISRRLIFEIEAEITRRYRAADYPFVSVSTPAQEISTGVVQFRVVEFHLGTKSTPGASAADARYLDSRIRAAPGDGINAARLGQDLDWLNRFPFRRTEAEFAPGAGFGATDLRLKTSRVGEVSVYAGYANSGSPLTGLDRYFAGGQAAVPGLHDAVASYQFTGSGDVPFGDGEVLNTAPDPRYISHAGRLTVPTLARQDIEVSIDFVQSNQPSQAFIIRQTTYEATLAYRSALSNFAAALPGEAAVGVELKRQERDVLFGPSKVTSASIDIFQITLTYAQQESDRFGRTSGDLTLHISPGSVDPANTGAALAAFSHGHGDAATHAYVTADLSRTTQLPALFSMAGWTATTSLIGQYAAVALPLTEQIGLGGVNLVRGYSLDDGAFDAGAISRNELRAPEFRPFSTGWPNRLSPFVFLDAGLGEDLRSHRTSTAASSGLGADYAFGDHLSASADVAWPMISTGQTRRGDARIESRITVSF